MSFLDSEYWQTLLGKNLTNLGISDVSDQAGNPQKNIKEANELGEKLVENLTGRNPVSGKSVDRGGRIGAGAGIAAEGIKALNDWTVDILVKVKVEEDLKYVLPEIEAKMPNGLGGVLVGINLGKDPNSAGDYHTTYLGLSVLTSGRDADDAKQKLLKGRGEKQAMYGQLGVCSIADANAPSQRGPQLKAAPGGRNHDYSKKVSENLLKYRNKNPRNEQLNVGGGILTRAYTDERLLFINRGALEKIKKL